MGEVVLGGAVGVNVAGAGDGLAQLLGKFADIADARATQQVDLTLQLGNDLGLRRIEGDGSQPQLPILHEHEKQDRQQRSALIGG